MDKRGFTLNNSIESKFSSNIENFIKKSDLTIALAGNPNSGKSSIFNQSTGLDVMTANYAGKTVDLNFSQTEFENKKICLMDLPGIYSIEGMTEDQRIARDALLNEKIDVVIYIADSTNLSRNLYMLLQLMELKIKLVLALNFSDLLSKRGQQIDYIKLSDWLGIPVVPTIASSGFGIEELFSSAIKRSEETKTPARTLLFGKDIEKEIFALSNELAKLTGKLPFNLSPETLAIFILEKNSEILGILRDSKDYEKILKLAEVSWKNIHEKHAEEPSTRIIKERHGLAGSIAESVLKREEKELDVPSKLWLLSTHPIWGPIILLSVFTIIFVILFQTGSIISEFISGFWSKYVSSPAEIFFINLLGKFWGKIAGWGINEGFFAVLSLGISYILVFYILLAILEDSGYLNAIAFLMDKFMHKLGLHGTSGLLLVTSL